jgi:hypothetical protein
MDNQDPNRPDDRQPEILPDFTSLVVLLSIFFTVGIISLLVIVTGTGERLEQETTGLRAYGPADFAEEIDWEGALHAEPPDSGTTGPGAAFQVPPPPFSDEDIFPCSNCHDPEDPPSDLSPRRLEDFHEEMAIEHGPADRWCFDCHNPVDRDKLRLVNGVLVGFDESYRLCGQCHGTIYRDWRMGIHGRRTGYWNGAKTYLLCAHCHNPHKPRFEKLKPLPPPVRPGALRSAIPVRAHE